MRKALLSVPFLILFASVLLAQAPPEGAPQDKPTMGTRLCSNCHLDIFNTFQKSAHGVHADPRTPEAKEGCEDCHGNGSDHAVAGGGKGVGGLMVFNADVPVEKKNSVCLGCHEQGRLALWHASVHDSKSLACTDCHKVHSTNTHLLVKATQSETCAGCHQDILGQLQLSSHHPIREGKVDCADCHNPHGTPTDKLISANSVNEKCYECHADKRGPFLWEHPPARENCMNCHTPHGSAHENLLVGRLPYLCQRCHSDNLHPGLMYSLPQGVPPESAYQQQLLGVLPMAQMYYRSCSNCHVNVHGSNHPSGSLWHR